jgi:hypothetical protein
MNKVSIAAKITNFVTARSTDGLHPGNPADGRHHAEVEKVLTIEVAHNAGIVPGI